MTFPLAAHVGTPEAMTCPHGHAPPWDKAPALHMRGTWLHCCRDCAPVTYMLFVFTLDTGPSVTRVQLSAAQYRACRALAESARPDELFLSDYLDAIRKEAA